MSDYQSIGIAGCKDPRDFQENYFGKVVTSEGIAADPVGYAEVFSEGSEELKCLLLDLWEHGVKTLGCCIGHEGVPDYYKNTFHGKEWITEEEYNKHSKLFWYHRVIEDKGGYFSFVVPDGYGGEKDKLQYLSECVRDGLDELNSTFPVSRIICEYNDVHACDSMQLYFDYSPCMENVERTFAEIHMVLRDVFEFDKGLDSQILDAKECEEDLYGDVDALIDCAKERQAKAADPENKKEHDALEF